MRGCTGAELDQLLELRRVLGRRADDVRDAALEVHRAIEHVRDGATDAVPVLPPHRARGVVLAERLDDLARQVAVTHDELRAADRSAVVGAAAWVDGRIGEHATVHDALHAGDELWGRWRHAVLTRDAGVLASPAYLSGSAGTHLAGAGWRQQLAATGEDLRRLRGGAAVEAVGTSQGRVARAVARFQGSRAGAVTRLGGRALGVAGIGMGVADMVDGYRAGDEEQVLTGALGTAASIAMLSGAPPVQLAGAVVAAGLLVYEHREQLGAGVRAVGRGVGAAAGAAAAFVRGLF